MLLEPGVLDRLVRARERLGRALLLLGRLVGRRVAGQRRVLARPHAVLLREQLEALFGIPERRRHLLGIRPAEQAALAAGELAEARLERLPFDQAAVELDR